MSDCALPFTVIEPVSLSFGELSGTRPARAFSIDVFPLPEGPINASSLPGSRLPLTSLRMVLVPTTFLILVSTV